VTYRSLSPGRLPLVQRSTARAVRLPAVGLPLVTAERLPCGVCLVAAPCRDLDLLDLAIELGDR